MMTVRPQTRHLKSSAAPVGFPGGKVISKIYMNWETLQRYFSVTIQNDCQKMTPAQRYKARELLKMLQDKVNHVCLTFALPVITEFERVNAFFQSSKANPDKALGELDLHHRSLKSRVYDNCGNQKSLSQIDFGAKFIAEFNDLRKYVVNSENTLLVVKQRCLEMLLECISQVEKRLPDQRTVFSELVVLSPEVILSQIRRVNFGKLPYQYVMGRNTGR